MGRAKRYLRRSGAHLWHAGDLLYRTADRRSGQFRHCPVFNRAGAGWLKRPLGIAIELLAAIPSIVYGMWGLFIFAPLFATYFRGAGRQYSFQHSVCRRAVLRPGVWYRHSGGGRHPRHHDHPLHCGGYARRLRANTGNDEKSPLTVSAVLREVIWRIVLPFTKNGVIGGIMLGLGRALGETMAVTFIIGNTYQLDSASLYMPGNSITSALANEFAEAESGLHVAALMELGLILFVITFIVWRRLSS